MHNLREVILRSCVYKGEIKVVQTKLRVADHPRCHFQFDGQ